MSPSPPLHPRSDTAPSGQRPGSETFRDFLTVLYKRRKLFWGVFLLFSVSAWWFGETFDPIYRANAQVYLKGRLETVQSEDVDNPGMSRYRKADLSDVASEMELMRSRDVVDGVCTNPEFLVSSPWREPPKDQAWGDSPEEDRRLAWRFYILTNFEANAIPNTNVVNLTMKDWDAQRAADIVNALADSYAQYRSGSLGGKIRLEELTDQAANAKKSFKEAEASLHTFKSENGLLLDLATMVTSLTEKSTKLLDQINELDGAIERGQIQIVELQELLGQGSPLLLGLPEIANNQAVIALQASRSDISLKIVEALQHNLENSAEVASLRGQMESASSRMQAVIGDIAGGLVRTAETELMQNGAVVDDLRKKHAEAVATLSDVGRASLEMESLQNDLDRARDAYNLAEKRVDSAKTTGLTLPDFLVDVGGYANVPQFPSFPPLPWIRTTLAILGGLFFALTSVFLGAFLDRSLDTPGQAERETRIPVLATFRDERIQSSRKG